MSSHHFVRDMQEPALLIANGAACSDILLHELLEWNPFVLALDGALARLLAKKIRVDAAIGDFDSIKKGNITNSTQFVKMIHKPSQELTDLEKGLEYLCELGHQSVNIVWATGWRADHTFANITNIVKFKNKITINIIDDYSRIFTLPKKFEKWYPAKTILSLIPVGRVEGIITQNLHYPLADECLEIGIRLGTSNHVSETGWVNISHKKGHLLLLECFDRPDL